MAAPLTDETRHAEAARRGDLDAIFELMDQDGAEDNDRLAYKWLCAAADFGHEEADERLGDLLETSSLRYDDDGFIVAFAHWELGVAYLAGDHGLAVDLALGDKHLNEALSRHSLDMVSGSAGEPSAAAIVRDRLSPEALHLFEFHLGDGDLYRRVTDRIARVERLRACKAPEVIVAHERGLLLVALDALLAAGPAGLAGAPGLPVDPSRSLEAIQLLAGAQLVE
jgi:hypothetical protein